MSSGCEKVMDVIILDIHVSILEEESSWLQGCTNWHERILFECVSAKLWLPKCNEYIDVDNIAEGVEEDEDAPDTKRQEVEEDNGCIGRILDGWRKKEN